MSVAFVELNGHSSCCWEILWNNENDGLKCSGVEPRSLIVSHHLSSRTSIDDVLSVQPPLTCIKVLSAHVLGGSVSQQTAEDVVAQLMRPI